MLSSLAPWINVTEPEQAITFYKAAFGATELFRAEPFVGVIVRLSIGSSELWVSGDPNAQPQVAARMILTVDDPHAVFAQAIAAGAREIYAVQKQHGWLIGRLQDPAGLHWEIGHLLPA